MTYIACVNGPQIKIPRLFVIRSLRDPSGTRHDGANSPIDLRLGTQTDADVERSRDGILRIHDDGHRMAMRCGRDGPQSGAFLHDGTDALMRKTDA